VTVIAIDLNVRVRGEQTYAGFEDVEGPLPRVGDTVRVRESESRVQGTAVVTEVDQARQIVYLAVDWSALTSPEAARSSAVNGEPPRDRYRVADTG
jgi:hypothetical protein